VSLLARNYSEHPRPRTKPMRKAEISRVRPSTSSG
jgi:hypothetical protein